jgi:hypothetical protein
VRKVFGQDWFDHEVNYCHVYHDFGQFAV